MKGKWQSLEIGRFIAASLVMICHLGPSVAKYGNLPATNFLRSFNPSAIAVEYFFVLSGFVLAASHVNDFGKIGAVTKFLWRRACRIYPLYWLAILIPFFFQIKNMHQIMILRFISLVPVTTSELIIPAWTLRFEVAFYIGFALCLLPYIGRPLLAVWSIMTFWLTARYGLEVKDYQTMAPHWVMILRHGWTMEFFSPLTVYFISGVVTGLMFSKLQLPKNFCWLILILSSVFFAAGVMMTRGGSIYGTANMHIDMALIMAGLILSFALAENSGLLNIGKFGGILGAMSYPIYILHWTMFIIYDQVFGSLRFNSIGLCSLYAAGLITIYGVSAIITFGFDQPLQKFLRRIDPSSAVRIFLATK